MTTRSIILASAMVLSCFLYGQEERSQPIVVPGTRTEVTAALGTVTVKCEGSGTCATIYVSRRIAQLPNADGSYLAYSFSRYKITDTPNGHTLELFDAKRTK